MRRYLRSARMRRGMTQAAVSRLLHVVQSEYSRIERGQRPVAERLEDLAPILSMELSLLVKSERAWALDHGTG